VKEKYWEGKNYAFFQNKECEYFPCHKTDDIENFNCLFCYCPLYALGDKCGGDFIMTDKGIKNCSKCLVPHMRDNYGYITGKYEEIAEIVRKQIAKGNEEKIRD